MIAPPRPDLDLHCLACSSKACKRAGQDCTGLHDELVARYHAPEPAHVYQVADGLVTGGRAGQLGRVEELTEFCRQRGLVHVALAYCYGLEPFARRLSDHLAEAGLQIASYRCTLGGVREQEILPTGGASVGCDPLGQALAINRSSAELVVEIGLCLGHDLLFHQELRKPLTVLVVKDRRFGHAPTRFFDPPQPSPGPAPPETTARLAALLRQAARDGCQRSVAYLHRRLREPDPPRVLDLREPAQLEAVPLPGTLPVPLAALPERQAALLPERDGEVICIGDACQAALALAFLAAQGYSRLVALTTAPACAEADE